MGEKRSPKVRVGISEKRDESRLITAEEKLGASVIRAQVNDCGADTCIRSRMQRTFTPRALEVL